MTVLYYNCEDPLAVVAAGVILPSKIHTGVSLSEWSELGSHGPFKLALANVHSQAHRVAYWQFVPRSLKEKRNPHPEAPYAGSADGEVLTRAAYEARRDALAALVGDMILPRVWKHSFMFVDEREWYAPRSIRFAPSDVLSITFMTNAPCIHPRRAKKARAELQAKFAPIYTERVVYDPYLSRQPDTIGDTK